MNQAYLSLGSNDGDRIAFLKEAIALINEQCGHVANISKVYETAAWGNEDQPDFLNIALELRTPLQPMPLLNALRNIEHTLGRKRTVKWGQRTLDIDILFFNNYTIDEEQLTIPHPGLHLRLFVLIPLAEIAPEMMHPLLQKTVIELLANCPDNLPVRLSSLQL